MVALGSGDSCELCGTELTPSSPRQVADLDAQILRRACGTCSLLFRLAGAGGGRFRTVPERTLVDPELVSDAQWVECTGIPGQLAFLIYCSARDRWLATFPSPDGPIERELDPEVHRRLVELLPLVAEIEPDVEALLVRRPPGEVDLACYLVPIDVCYELAGRLRRLWRGSLGGEAGRRAVDEIFVDLAARSQAVIRRRAG